MFRRKKNPTCTIEVTQRDTGLINIDVRFDPPQRQDPDPPAYELALIGLAAMMKVMDNVTVTRNT